MYFISIGHESVFVCGEIWWRLRVMSGKKAEGGGHDEWFGGRRFYVSSEGNTL